MSYSREVYDFAKKNFNGIKEVPGSTSNPIINDMHQLCFTERSDEIPWCSSFMNFCYVTYGLKKNPKMMVDFLLSRKHSLDFIKTLFRHIGVNDMTSIEFLIRNDTKESIVLPELSAWARSWLGHQPKNGMALLPQSKSELEIGDIVILNRGSGKGHVAFFEKKLKFGLQLQLFGGNQGNMSCSNDSYLSMRFLGAKRSIR